MDFGLWLLTQVAWEKASRYNHRSLEEAALIFSHREHCRENWRCVRAPSGMLRSPSRRPVLRPSFPLRKAGAPMNGARRKREAVGDLFPALFFPGQPATQLFSWSGPGHREGRTAIAAATASAPVQCLASYVRLSALASSAPEARRVVYAQRAARI